MVLVIVDDLILEVELAIISKDENHLTVVKSVKKTTPRVSVIPGGPIQQLSLNYLLKLSIFQRRSALTVWNLDTLLTIVSMRIILDVLVEAISTCISVLRQKTVRQGIIGSPKETLQRLAPIT